MATVSNRVATWIYGMVQGGPPYIGSDPFARTIVFSEQVKMNFPTLGTVFHPTTQGIRFGSNYVYSVVEVNPTGLNQQSVKFGSSDSVATLATGSQI
jgi:hypothetical protein